MTRVIWCLGMYASASTWLFNVVREMAAPHGEVETHFWAGPADLSGPAQAGRLTVIKSHEISDPATVEWLSKHAEKIIVSIRDPRDAVTSLMMYHGYPFERALDHVDASARLCVRFAAERQALVLHYESAFFEKPETLGKLASFLEFESAADTNDMIFNRLRRAEVEKHIANMPRLPGILQDRVSGDMLDPRTHWHTHHAGRSGEIGRWRHRLTAAQAKRVEAKLTGCFSFASDTGPLSL
jgi:hypothetical protein